MYNFNLGEDMANEKRRIELLDELRGFAILAMIVHHLFLDIGDVLSVDWGYTVFDKLCVIQPIFWSIFIIISGICSRLSRNTVKRGAIVLCAGAIVSLVTAFIMPKIMHIYGAEIYFGILSCLGVCMIITGLLMPVIEKINATAGMVATAIVFLALYGFSDGTILFGLVDIPTVRTNWFMPFGLYNAQFHSADYFAIIPWIFMFLFGAFLGKNAKAGAFPAWTYKKRSKLCAFVGRNSLWFYLGHQVAIYAILYAFLGILKLYVKLKV